MPEKAKIPKWKIKQPLAKAEDSKNTQMKKHWAISYPRKHTLDTPNISIIRIDNGGIKQEKKKGGGA